MNRKVTRDSSAPPDARPAARPTALFGIAAAIGLALAVVALFLFGWLADEMLEGDTVTFDLKVRAAVHALASPGLTRIFVLVSLLGGPVVLAPLGLLLAGIFAWRRWWRAAILLLVSMAGAAVLDLALKHAFHRARPIPFFNRPGPASYSFPSGHALFAFCFFTTAAALLAPRLRQPALRWLVWILAVVLILAVGISRIYLGVHYPSDVVAGYTAGLLWSSVIVVGDRVVHARTRLVGEG